MKFIKTYEDIVSWDGPKEKMGSQIPDTDEHLILIKDLVLELEDNGYNVIKKGYYAYQVGYITYDIFVIKSGKYEIFDISNGNDINIELDDIIFLRDSMKDIASRLISNGLYLGSHNLNMKDSELYSHSRFFKRIDGEAITGFTYKT